jgi:hypothetical protein
MDAIATHLAPISSRVAVPRSVPGLVTKQVGFRFPFASLPPPTFRLLQPNPA